MSFKDRMKKKNTKLSNSIRKSKQHNPNKFSFYGSYAPIKSHEISDILESYNEYSKID